VVALIGRSRTAGAARFLALMVLSGCAMQPAGNGGASPGDGQGGSLAPAQLDGAWMFVPDSDAIPSECYEFDAGTIVFYSSFCDDVTDLEEPVPAEIDGAAFSLTFEASLLPAGATVHLEGTVIDEDTIRVQMTITEIGATEGLTAPGRLVRGE